MYGGPKGLGDPNYRHEHSQVNSYTLYDFLIFQRYVENGGRPYDTTGSGMPHILLICSTFHSLSFSSRECGTLQEHSCVRRRWHSSYLYLNLCFMYPQIGILAPPMQPLLSYFQFFLLKVAEFSECSKTNGFSFVMHCRKAKDDMVLFTPSSQWWLLLCNFQSFLLPVVASSKTISVQVACQKAWMDKPEFVAAVTEEYLNERRWFFFGRSGSTPCDLHQFQSFPWNWDEAEEIRQGEI